MNPSNKTITTIISASFMLLASLTTSVLAAGHEGAEHADDGAIGYGSKPEGSMASGEGKKHPSSCRHDKPFSGMLKKEMIKKLGLDEGQQANLMTVQELMQAMKQAEQENMPKAQMMELLSAFPFDQAEASNIIGTKIAKMQQHSSEMIPAVAAFLDSLTDEQRAEMQTMSTQHAEACKNGTAGEGAWNNKRGRVSTGLDVYIPSTTIELIDDSTEYWVDLEYKGKDSEDHHSWRLKGYGKNEE
jgi:Spy/CpxP family protein refolding chaperone